MTRVQNDSAAAIDNIFIDLSQFENYTVTPITNGMSDHDAQLLMISTDYFMFHYINLKPLGKLINTQYLTF